MFGNDKRIGCVRKVEMTRNAHDDSYYAVIISDVVSEDGTVVGTLETTYPRCRIDMTIHALLEEGYNSTWEWRPSEIEY